MNELSLQQQRVLKVLERISAAVKDDDDAAEMWATELEIVLDSLCEQDAFGTECQCDPRGDQRDDAGWSLQSRIDGVDALTPHP